MNLAFIMKKRGQKGSEKFREVSKISFLNCVCIYTCIKNNKSLLAVVQQYRGKKCITSEEDRNSCC